MYATTSKFLSVSMYFYIAIHTHHISALPQNTTITTNSQPQPAVPKDSTSLFTTLNVCSTLFGLGSLIVAIIGVVRLRMRCKPSHEIPSSMIQGNTHDTVQMGDTASDPSHHLQMQPTTGISTSIAPIRDYPDLSITVVSLPTLKSGDPYVSLHEIAEGRMNAQSPTRPPLEPLRLRSSRMLVTSTALRMSSLRTSTF
jgi:hypothetical protein